MALSHNNTEPPSTYVFYISLNLFHPILKCVAAITRHSRHQHFKETIEKAPKVYLNAHTYVYVA